MVQCRCCKKPIDKNKPETYIEASRGWYYHIECYQNWKAKSDDLYANAAESEWEDLLWDYLKREVRIPELNFQKFDHQWHTFLYKNRKKMTPKGLFYAAKYYYDIMKGNADAAKGGIGILPYVYDTSCTYWQNQTTINHDRVQQINKQLNDKENQEIIFVSQSVANNTPSVMSIADVLAMEDDEYDS